MFDEDIISTCQYTDWPPWVEYGMYVDMGQIIYWCDNSAKHISHPSEVRAIIRISLCGLLVLHFNIYVSCLHRAPSLHALFSRAGDTALFTDTYSSQAL